MSAAPLLDEHSTQRWPHRAELSPYAVVLRSCRDEGDPPLAASELIGSLAARLGVALTFDDVGYDAEFTVVAEDDLDAITTARRRWFYLASDLEIPSWPITDVAVHPLGRTHASTW